MDRIKITFLFLIIILGSTCYETTNNTPDVSASEKKISKPKVSFTFDDGITHGIAGYKFKEWNQMILDALNAANLKSMFFVTGFNKLDDKGKFLLESWNKENHQIANHTFSHPNFNDKNNTLKIFESELLRTDSIIKQYSNHTNYFRFPYLKEGKTKEKIEGIRSILKDHKYKNGYVTIDASDWYINSRLIKKMKSGEPVDTTAFRDFYLRHILDRANFYDSLSYELNGRHIQHTLLLHHNLTSALFLGDLIKKFEKEGWEITNAIDAYKGPIYQKVPKVVTAGESLIWSLAKESGKFKDKLRYPAEDSRYEKDEMDRLNL